MSARFYDEALVKKLRYWTSNTNVKIYNPSETRRLFEVIADETNDKPIKLPIICVRRPGGYQIVNNNRQPLSYRSKTIGKTPEKVMNLNAIPIELRYQIDIYTRYYDEADEFVRNLVFNFINFPSLTVVLTYLGEDIEHNSSITLAQEVEDNSDVPERFIQGNFTRLSLGVVISNAYLWDVRVSDTVSIDGFDIVVEDREEDDGGGGKGIIIREKDKT